MFNSKLVPNGLRTALLLFVIGEVAMTSAVASGDLTKGEQLYLRCTGCHSPAYNRTGPRHCGLLGRKAGSLADFDYSKAMRQADFVWTEPALDQFLQAPLDFIPGTRMTVTGIESVRERQALIRYLTSLDGDNPACQ